MLQRSLAAPTSVILALLLTLQAHARPQYVIIDLTETAPVNQAVATSVNEAGAVAGWELVGDFIEQAVFWDDEHVGQLLEMLPGDNSNVAVHINEDGLVAGVSEEVTTEQQGEIIIITEDQKAALWQGSAVTDLNTMVTGGDALDLRVAWSATIDGKVVGRATPPGETAWRGFLFDNGVVTDLGFLDTGQAASRPVDINSAGLIVGHAAIGQDKAFLWNQGVLTNLHDHPSLQGVTSQAWDINDSGQIVGRAQFLISDPEVPAMWLEGEPIDLLGDLFGRPQGNASAINEKGQIVGWVNDLDDLNDETRGFIIDGGEFHELIDLLAARNGWDQLIEAWDINEQGWIVGGGRRFGQLGHAFLMIPLAEGDLDGDGFVNIDDLLILLAEWGPCADCNACAADLDGDCEVAIEDLLALLANWS